jgi:hypothetical protein
MIGQVDNLTNYNRYPIYFRYETMIGKGTYYYSITNISKDTLNDITIGYELVDFTNAGMFDIPTNILNGKSLLHKEQTMRIKKMDPGDVNYFFFQMPLEKISIKNIGGL